LGKIVSHEARQPHEDLLDSYDTAIRELRRLRDPKLTDLLRRLELRQAQLVDFAATGRYPGRVEAAR
jgi:hypothetical protein